MKNEIVKTVKIGEIDLNRQKQIKIVPIPKHKQNKKPILVYKNGLKMATQ